MSLIATRFPGEELLNCTLIAPRNAERLRRVLEADEARRAALQAQRLVAAQAAAAKVRPVETSAPVAISRPAPKPLPRAKMVVAPAPKTAPKPARGQALDGNAMVQFMMLLALISRPADPFGGEPMLADIAKAVCKRHKVSLADLRGHRRLRKLTLPRMEAMYLMRVHTGKSLPVIGHYLNRDHTTVLYGSDKHATIHGLPKPWLKAREDAQ